MHDSSQCPVCRSLPTGGSMTDEEFHAFLEVCRAELAEKQTRFQTLIGTSGRWFYDLADGSLTLREAKYAMTPIGTHSAEYASWLWAWANEDYPPAARADAKRLQGLFDLTGFRVFTDPGIDASSADAQDFTALAVHCLGAAGFFRVPSKGPTLYLAVYVPDGGNR